ncbi:MAG: hypothetical protein V4498_00565 [candidate division FCPU426 bacterium]
MKASEVKPYNLELNIVTRERFQEIEAAHDKAANALRTAIVRHGALCGKVAFEERLAHQEEADQLRKIRNEARELLFRSVIDVEEGLTWGRPTPKVEA